MSLSNVRLKVTYGTTVLGIGTGLFLDASRSPITLERRGAVFVFSADVVVAEATQDAFAAACAALEAAFDPASNPAGALRIETDSVLWQQLDPAGACSYRVVDYTQLAGKVFTVTANGTAYTLTEGVDFAAATSNAATAIALKNAINAKAGLSALVAADVFSAPETTNARVFVQSRDLQTYSLAVVTNASGSGAIATSPGRTGFNARPSIRKPGSEDDTALSRRYVVSVEVDLPATAAGKNGRLDESIEISETDSRQKLLKIAGTYTALGQNTALEQYAAQVDTFADQVQDALGGTWEGPFDVVARPDLQYVFPTDGTSRLGRVVRFSRSYQELIYPRSLGDDVRLRRASLRVSVKSPGPGDFGPNGTPVFRMRSVAVVYDAGVDKTATQDLKAIFTSVVKPFLEAEARKALDGEQIALVNQEPTLDRTKNRVSCRMEYLAAKGNLVQSTVSTQDTDEAGLQLVSVWNGDPLGKQRYDGPQNFRRTVRQSYTVLSGPGGTSGKNGIGGQTPASSAFGIFAINAPRAYALITAPSSAEAAIDDFFGISSGSSSRSSSGGDASFPTSGGVAEPKGLTRAYRGGEAIVEPLVVGRFEDLHFTITRITKTKTYEYYRPAPATGGGGGPSRTPSPGAGAERPKVATGPGTSIATQGAGGPLTS